MLNGLAIALRENGDALGLLEIVFPPLLFLQIDIGMIRSKESEIL